MLTAARVKTAVTAALPVSHSRSSRSSSRGIAAPTAAQLAGGRQRQRHQARRPPLPPLPLAASASAASAAAAAAAAATASAAAEPTITTATLETKLGPLKIRPLTKEDAAAAAVVLVRAFTANGSSLPLADVEEWLFGALEESSETVVLVAELVPENK